MRKFVAKILGCGSAFWAVFQSLVVHAAVVLPVDVQTALTKGGDDGKDTFMFAFGVLMAVNIVIFAVMTVKGLFGKK